MNKVYIIIGHDYDESNIYGVYSTKEKAEKILTIENTRVRCDYNRYSLDEYIIDKEDITK